VFKDDTGQLLLAELVRYRRDGPVSTNDLQFVVSRRRRVRGGLGDDNVVFQPTPRLNVTLLDVFDEVAGASSSGGSRPSTQSGASSPRPAPVGSAGPSTVGSRTGKKIKMWIRWPDGKEYKNQSFSYDPGGLGIRSARTDVRGYCEVDWPRGLIGRAGSVTFYFNHKQYPAVPIPDSGEIRYRIP
jgi:hypothetical protein